MNALAHFTEFTLTQPLVLLIDVGLELAQKHVWSL
jgi:hypothetical protein